MEIHSSWAPLQQQQQFGYQNMNDNLGQMLSTVTEQNSLFTENSGMNSILSKYKSKSLVQAYPNSFQQISKSVSIIGYRSALYCGNASDLWQYFKFNLKYEIKKLKIADRRILRIFINFVQYYFLQMAVQRMPKCLQKQQLKEKTKHFIMTYLKRQEQKQLIIELLRDQYEQKSNYCEFLKMVRNLKFCQSNIEKIINQLFTDYGGTTAIKLYQSTIDFVLKLRQQNDQADLDKKRKTMMRLMGLHLKFILHNQHWKDIVLSSKITSELKLYHLSQPNGVNSLVYFYRDAPLKILQQQLEKTQQIFMP